ncbi:class I SAM-dependent methyltransferase [Actinomadura rudentiformis]|uniref:Class I SAM-dependent methyltransferase n=1 Tax=Actinomadura rudentiformis TaxID=359158 RepID=A0A6H9YPV1_9ACTN|nr:class I SAM-dependent methyltransferase [Actinomadura rudentiformis]KAB2342077.1 class I SAM-dependent methyltransferase [Actinomadura rudentiformis]
MPHPATEVHESGGTVTPHVRRLLDFAEPTREDVCLDVARGRGPMPAALSPQVRHVTAVDAAPPPSAWAGRPDGQGRVPTVEFGTGPVRIADADGDRDPAATHREIRRSQHFPSQRTAGDRQHDMTDPDGFPIESADALTVRAETVRAEATALPYQDNAFSLVTTRFSLYNLGDPAQVLRELLRVTRPGGRLIIADVVRTNLAGADRDWIERVKNPDHPGTFSIAGLTDLITSAGANVRRLDVFTVERPVEPWLAGAHSLAAAAEIREALEEEVDGGPRTGAKPRIIGGELWFTQNWAHVAAEPI